MGGISLLQFLACVEVAVLTEHLGQQASEFRRASEDIVDDLLHLQLHLVCLRDLAVSATCGLVKCKKSSTCKYKF